ncbi:DUF4878 domain-containing protein [Snodgrassella sp. B3882]|uniref:DUF4878 domain-containing protein n=1 Tax=Snodgrassella sp. B3882 TaxID=2818037 RepID=UPI00226A4ADA|nr:DUF4878 domain-containing protein [Snodgrassella sp. B3882]MCX8745637.1 DUF4878 domain-containing protein [Snodgrassella sp. B3882]
MKKLISLLTTLMLIFVITACNKGSTPESVAKDWVEAIYSGNEKTVVSLIYFKEEEKKDKELQKIFSGKMKKLVEQTSKLAKQNGGIKKIDAEKARLSNDKQYATVKVNVSFNNSQEIDSTDIELKKTKTGWMIYLDK